MVGGRCGAGLGAESLSTTLNREAAAEVRGALDQEFLDTVLAV